MVSTLEFISKRFLDTPLFKLGAGDFELGLMCKKASRINDFFKRFRIALEGPAIAISGDKSFPSIRVAPYFFIVRVLEFK